MGWVAVSQAAIINTFTDLGSFQSITGPVTTFDFDTSPIGIFTSIDFGDFTVSEAGPNDLTISIRDGTGPSSVNSTPHLNFLANCCNVPDTMDVMFDTAIVGFGLDFNNADQPIGSVPGDFTILLVDGQTFNVGGPTTAGFFGFTSDMPIVGFSFQDNPPQGAIDSTGFDNFRYTSTLAGPNPIPEPSSFFLMSLGFLGLAFVRKKHQL